jgi:hypothetical protein
VAQSVVLNLCEPFRVLCTKLDILLSGHTFAHNACRFHSLFRFLGDELPKSLLTETEKQQIITSVSKRQNIAVDDCHFLATVLHPLYGSKYLEPEEFGKAIAAMESMGQRLSISIPALHREFSEYQRRQGRYSIESLMKPIRNMSCAAWWLTYHGDTLLHKVRINL